MSNQNAEMKALADNFWNNYFRPKVADATRYEAISFDQVLTDNLKVMDASAIALCRENHIPIVVFNIREEGNLAKVLAGEGTATIVQNQER